MEEVKSCAISLIEWAKQEGYELTLFEALQIAAQIKQRSAYMEANAISDDIIVEMPPIREIALALNNISISLTELVYKE